MSPVREHTAMVKHAKALDRSHRRRRFSPSLKSYTGSIPPTGASFIIWSSFSDSSIARTIQAASDFVVAMDRINAALTARGLRFPVGTILGRIEVGPHLFQLSTMCSLVARVSPCARRSDTRMALA
jgi:hypothetical protein